MSGARAKKLVLQTIFLIITECRFGAVDVEFGGEDTWEGLVKSSFDLCNIPGHGDAGYYHKGGYKGNIAKC